MKPDLTLKPIGKWFGFERGNPIDRYYIEKFLNVNRNCIKGTVLEIGDNRYTKKYGSEILQSDVLDIKETEKCNIVGDLETGLNISLEKYDCVICTQVIQCIFNLNEAIRNIHKSLKVGGVALLTASGNSPIWVDNKSSYVEYWRFTDNSMRQLLSKLEPESNVKVSWYGNLAAVKAFMDGYAQKDLPEKVLDTTDYQFQLTVCGSMKKS